MIPRLWTENENQRFREMCARGVTFREIAKAFDRDQRGCQKHARILGIAPRRNKMAWDPSDDVDLIEMRNRKVPFTEIAEYLGRDEGACKRRMRRLAIMRNGEQNAPKLAG